MGSCKSKHSDATTIPGTAPTREVKIVVFGLDNSGKSTLLANLNGDSTDDITPTIGFANVRLNIGNCAVTFYDVGGGPRIRGIWKNYFSEAYGIIYVVDASTPERFTEATNALNEVMQSEKIVRKPLLVFANKQDQEDACDDLELANQLDLDQMLGLNRQYSTVVKCIALKKASNRRSDPSLYQGVSWLLQNIVERYEEISERVRVDVTAQREREAEERRQRMERVKKMREEREREQVLSGATEEVDGRELPPVNPFRPIAVVAVEVEKREKAAKEARKLQNQRPSVATPVETTSNLATGTQDVTRVDSVYASPGPSVLTLGRHSQSSISQSSSGLSDSESLTDVTPHSSTASLHLVSNLPLDLVEQGSRSSSPSIARRKKIDHLKGKKEKKQMLITRLKNRNKIVPAPHSSQLVSHAPVASTNTWTEAELECVLPEPSQTGSSETMSLQGETHQPLPALSTIRRVLPPLKISRREAGRDHRAFHSDEELQFLPQTSVVQVSHPPTVQTVI